MFQRSHYEKAVIDFFSKNPRLHQKYNSKNLITVIAQNMTLPTEIQAEIALMKLVDAGKITRTDGRTDLDDANEAVEATKKNFERVVAEVEAPPLSREELEVFYSMNPRERAQHYWAGDPPGYNSFRIRFDKAIKEHGFEQPARTWGPGA